MDTTELSDILTFCKQTLKEEFSIIFKDNAYSAHPQYYWMLAHSLVPTFKSDNTYHVKVLDMICDVLGDKKYKYSTTKKISWLTKQIDAWQVKNNVVILNTYMYNGKLQIRRGNLSDIAQKDNPDTKLYKLKHIVEYTKLHREYKIGQVDVKINNKIITKLFSAGYLLKYSWTETDTQELSNRYTKYGDIPELFKFLRSYDPKTLANTMITKDWEKTYFYNQIDAIVDYHILIAKPLSTVQIELLRDMKLNFNEALYMIEQSKQTPEPIGIEMPIFE